MTTPIQLTIGITPSHRSQLCKAWLLLEIEGMETIPVAEEFYYRGFLLPRMSRLGWLAAVAIVLLWALNHFFEPWNIILYFLIFLPVGFVVWWKKNVYVSTAAHIIANLMAVLPMVSWLASGAA